MLAVSLFPLPKKYIPESLTHCQIGHITDQIILTIAKYVGINHDSAAVLPRVYLDVAACQP